MPQKVIMIFNNEALLINSSNQKAYRRVKLGMTESFFTTMDVTKDLMEVLSLKETVVQAFGTGIC